MSTFPIATPRASRLAIALACALAPALPAAALAADDVPVDLSRVVVRGKTFPANAAEDIDQARKRLDERAGATALVQISAIGADVGSASEYGRTKGEGEQAVRAAFPSATVIRPSLVFGPEDDLTNRFAAMARLPFLPVIASKRNFQPVYVRDLANAIALAALEPGRFGGKTFEIGGPQVMSMTELHHAVLEITGQDPEIVHMPDFFASLIAKLGWLPGAPITHDQWLMLQRDNVPMKGAAGLEAFGIEPTPLAAVGYEWLGRFHRGGKFAGRRINLTATS